MVPLLCVCFFFAAALDLADKYVEVRADLEERYRVRDCFKQQSLWQPATLMRQPLFCVFAIHVSPLRATNRLCQESICNLSLRLAGLAFHKELHMSCRKVSAPFHFIPHPQDFTQPTSNRLLPDQPPQEAHVCTLVLDLEGTLVHSQWKVGRAQGTHH